MQLDLHADTNVVGSIDLKVLNEPHCATEQRLDDTAAGPGNHAPTGNQDMHEGNSKVISHSGPDEMAEDDGIAVVVSPDHPVALKVSEVRG